MTFLVLAASLVLGAPAQRELPIARLQRWLDRPTPISPRFLDHGQLELSLAGGTPHVYRLELRAGLFDVVSVGVTGHWLPGQPWPQLWPVGALALWRGRMFEIGGHYRPVLFPAVDRAAHFEPRAHFALASFTIGSGLFSAGLDVGAAHVRLPVADIGAPTLFVRETVFGGGFVVRVGNEWIGASADALAALGRDPLLVFEVKLDVRFDLAMVARRRRDGTPKQDQDPARPDQIHR
ncbi:hypothetical protein ACNOYE_11210 [Nannocystaceae bacterium ST9]